MLVCRWKPVFWGVVLLWALGTLPAPAQDWLDIEEPPSYDQQVPPAGYGYPQPMPPGYGYPQSYYPYPAPAVAPMPPAEKKPWYKKLFSPITNRMNPPIYREPKVPKDPPKETVAVKDPLIRLAKGVAYQGTEIPPGFYIMKVKPAGEDAGAWLSLYRKQEEIVSVPAFKKASEKPPVTTENSKLPPPPVTKNAEKPEQDAATDTGKDKAKEPEASALVELAQDGQSVILVYRTDDQEYTSLPLAVLAPWQP